MRKLMIIMLVIFFIGMLAYYYDKKERSISIEEIMQVESTQKLSGTWWHVVPTPNDYLFKEIGLSPNDFDFQENDLIITNGRKIKEMYFVRSNRFPFRKTNFALAVFKKELHSDTWFVYKISKMDIVFDEKLRYGNNQIEK